jgi:AraC-like DNA-binding protein
MFYEPSALASLTGLLATALQQEYATDPAPIFFQAGIPVMPRGTPKLRYPMATVRKLWQISKEATGDETIGLRAGTYAQPPLFYAFGYSWMASSTLLGGLQRLERYYQSMSTASVVIRLTELADSYALSAEFPEESKAPPKEGIDCGMTALLTLCDIVAEKEIRPVRVRLTCPSTVHPEAYRRALRAPIEFNAPVGTFYFAKDVLLEPLRHGTPDIAKATDKIAEQYIETLDPHRVASHVRRLLIALLPAGRTDQELVAKRLNRSASTLQRQLADEGLTYREVLESTRRSLAQDYLADGKHSQAQIAYMLGFSDQSNFSRAFKRWTKMSPKQYQDLQAR